MTIKKLSIMLLLAIMVFSTKLMADEELSPYLKVGTKNSTMGDAVSEVTSLLEKAGFEVLGDYAPEDSQKLHVIAYTRDDLQKICFTKEDRGVLASILKIGFVEKDGNITISMLNPMYLFYAYLGDEIEGHEKDLEKIAGEAKAALNSVGNELTPFGGFEEIDDLPDYRFMAMMPRFEDPEELNEFDSFEIGLQTIRKNLDAGKSNTVKVYELIFPEKEIAIFGVGLYNTEEGEVHFLPIIGEDNIAAMPYEIILQGKEATMLHGKYRFAVHWPQLTIGEFMKIMSTPEDVEDALESLTE